MTEVIGLGKLEMKLILKFVEKQNELRTNTDHHGLLGASMSNTVLERPQSSRMLLQLTQKGGRQCAST